MAEKSGEKLVVCLGVPAYHDTPYLERLRAAGVEPVALPVDEGADWAIIAPADPFPEPPPWAASVAEERRAALERADILIALHSPDRLAERAPKLRWIQGVGAGVEQFAKGGARRDRVVVTNASGVSAPSMAEWVVGRLLQVWKRFRDAEACQEKHVFERTYGRTFAGSTIGIVGLGSIGSAVAERLRPFGCRVLGLKRSYRPGDTSDLVDELYGPDQLHELLSQCDAAIVAAPDTPETRHLIDAAALAALPKSATLVNVARGALVDEDALAATMRRGDLAAAVLDVFEQEPLPPESPLWDLPNVYISAHSSVSIDRYMEDVFDLFVDNVERYVAGTELRNLVDMEMLGFE